MTQYTILYLRTLQMLTTHCSLPKIVIDLHEAPQISELDMRKMATDKRISFKKSNPQKTIIKIFDGQNKKYLKNQLMAHISL